MESAMSKILESPVKEFPGTIEFPDYLTLPQMSEYSDMQIYVKGKSDFTHALVMLPLQRKITKEWNITGLPKDRDFTVEQFKPVLPLLSLIEWIHKEILKLIMDEKEIPNA